jgi:hypothetical protein
MQLGEREPERADQARDHDEGLVGVTQPRAAAGVGPSAISSSPARLTARHAKRGVRAGGPAEQCELRVGDDAGRQVDQRVE